MITCPILSPLVTQPFVCPAPLFYSTALARIPHLHQREHSHSAFLRSGQHTCTRKSTPHICLTLLTGPHVDQTPKLSLHIETNRFALTQKTYRGATGSKFLRHQCTNSQNQHWARKSRPWEDQLNCDTSWAHTQTDSCELHNWSAGEGINGRGARGALIFL